MSNKTAIVPGSFDPMTLGHLSVIFKASEMFDEVIVAIMHNSEKKNFYTLAERKQIAEKTCDGLDNVKVITADGMLVDLAKALGTKYIVKGVRNVTDFEYEQTMARVNYNMAPSVQTIYLPSDPEFDAVSSTLVRELIKNGKNPADYVHPDALDIIMKNQ